MLGFCRSESGGVNKRVLDHVASVEECASFCMSCGTSSATEPPDGQSRCCTGISYSFDRKQRCFIYGPGQAEGLPRASPEAVFNFDGGITEWSGMPNSDTAVDHASGNGGQVICAAVSSGGGK